MPAFDAYEALYRDLGRAAAGAADTSHIPALLELWEEIGLLSGMRVLDYGCGWGAAAGVFDPALYHGIDICPSAVSLARAAFPEHSFAVSDPGTLDAGHFDFVIAGSVFTHTPFDLVLPSLRDIATALYSWGSASIDILVGDDDPKNPVNRHYASHDAFLEYLHAAGLDGTFMKRVMAPFAEHHHFKVWPLSPQS